jgi:hypothetical protein
MNVASSSHSITVVLPTYNPRPDFLALVLDGLRRQTLPVDHWDLLLVDNNSNPPLEGQVALGWHPRAGVHIEREQGKMRAIVSAFRQTRSELVVVLDDDTVPAQDYLERALRIAGAYPSLGTWSCRVELGFEEGSPEPHPRLRNLLSERLIATPIWSNDPRHPPSTPWGGGMCVRRTVADEYVEVSRTNPKRLQLDPIGDQPGYGGDTDIAYAGCAMGLGMGVFPELKVTHLIPSRRCSEDYLLRNLEAHTYSDLMHQWTHTGEAPRRPTVADRISALRHWLGADALGRKMLAARRRGHAAAVQTIASGVDARPVTHR